MSIAASIIFILAFLFFFSGVFMVKKSEKKLNAVICIPLSFISSLIYLSLVCAISSVICIPINLWSVAGICTICGSVCWFFIIRRKKCQSFKLCWFDIIALAVIILIAAYFAANQFGRSLVPVYETSDPSVHLKMAMDVVNSGRLEGMLFAPLFNALSIECFGVLLTPLYYYKVFVLTDAAFFLITGLVFYSVLSSRTDKNKYKICALALTAFYMIGYPLNNMVFGFVYLGMGVTLIAFIIFITNCYLSGEYNHTFIIITMMAACFSIAVCYVLFAPVVFFGVFVAISAYFLKKKKMISWHFVLEQLKVFVLPCVLSVYYILFSTSSYSSMSSLAAEGYIYRDLFSNFIFLIPAVLFACYKTLRFRKIDTGVYLFLFLAVNIIGFFLLGMYGKVSGYYYYKLYFPAWMLCFYLIFLAVQELKHSDFALAVCSLFTVASLFVISEKGIEYSINQRNVLFCPNVISPNLFNIYQFNKNCIIKDDYVSKKQEWEDRLELYSYAKEIDSSNSEGTLIVDYWVHVYWYEAVTNQRLAQYPWMHPEEYKKSILDSKYVIVIISSDEFKNDMEFYGSFDKVYENSIGFIAEVNK